MNTARGGLKELCDKQAMDEAVDALNRLAAWFGKIFATSNDGFWKIGNHFSPTNVVICTDQQNSLMRPMAVIDFADDGSKARLASLEINTFFTTLRELHLTITLSQSPPSSEPYTRVYVSVDSAEQVRAIPMLCQEIIYRRTRYVSASDYQALKNGTTDVTPMFFNKPQPNHHLIKCWQALCISKRDYLRLLRIEVWRDDWQGYGKGLFGKIVPEHVQLLRDCTRTEGNVDEQFERVKNVVERIPEDEERSSPRHPKVSKLYKRLKSEIQIICERIEERKPSPPTRPTL